MKTKKQIKEQSDFFAYDKIRKLAGSIKSKKVGDKRAIEKALTLEAKEVANEGKS